MKPWIVRTSLTLFVLLKLFFGGNAQGGDSECQLDVRVPRSTVWKGVTMEPLRIECPVNHCGIEPIVSWCKLDIDVCHPINVTDRIEIQQENLENRPNFVLSYLHFRNTFWNDSGLYRCGVSVYETIVSHSIKVTVIDAGEPGRDTPAFTTNAPVEKPHQDLGLQNWLPYIYISAGIVALLTTATGIFFLIIHCIDSKRSIKRSQQRISKKPYQTAQSPNVAPHPRSVRNHTARHTAVQHPAEPITIYDNAVQHPAEPITIYDNTPARTGSGTKRTRVSYRSTRNREPDDTPVTLCTGDVYDNDRGEETDEFVSVVYAALNHQAAQDGSGPSGRSASLEEISEYAAIRVT